MQIDAEDVSLLNMTYIYVYRLSGLNCLLLTRQANREAIRYFAIIWKIFMPKETVCFS